MIHDVLSAVNVLIKISIQANNNDHAIAYAVCCCQLVLVISSATVPTVGGAV